MGPPAHIGDLRVVIPMLLAKYELFRESNDTDIDFVAASKRRGRNWGRESENVRRNKSTLLAIPSGLTGSLADTQYRPKSRTYISASVNICGPSKI